MLGDALKIGPASDGRVVELVYTRDLKSLGFGLTGSSPVAPTIFLLDVGGLVKRTAYARPFPRERTSVSIPLGS